MDLTNLEIVKNSLIKEIQQRCEDKIIEPTNAKLLTELINNSDTVNKAISIAELGTTYKRTGFHFDKRIEKMGSDIKFLKKNEKLSFINNSEKNTHKLIIGDNYDCLLNLAISHKKSIDVIYIDPPYGADSMGGFAKMNYTNSLSRDNLLSMLYPRLIIAKELLSDDGVIFVSIDDKNQSYIKCLMDDIFGEENFIGCIPRITSFQRPGQEKYMNISHDYILVFSKDKSCNDFNNITERSIEKIIKEDKNGKYIEGDTKAILASKTQGYSKGGDYDFEYNGKIYSPVNKNGERNRWLWSEERMKAAAKLGILVETERTLRMQIYLDKKFDVETNTLIPKKEGLKFHTADFMKEKFDNPTGTLELEKILGGNIFSNPKPSNLIKALISFVSNDSAIVLDFFAGSGTTGNAVLELNREDGGNRTFILCTNNEITKINPNGIAYDVTSKRLKRIMDGKCYDNSNNFEWIKNNKPYGDNLEVLDIASVNNSENKLNKTPFDVIDETLYGIQKFKTIEEKISWVCVNFENTQKYLTKGM